MTPLEDDRPTLLLFGDGEPMLDALVAALSARAIVSVEDDADSAVAAVLANVPDVTIFVGDATLPERANALLDELAAHPLTAQSPVALLSSDDSLDARLRAAEHGAVTIVQRSASAHAMARQMLELATRLYDEPGVHEAGELAEASVDDLVQILGRELQSGILSITQADGARAERFVVRAGQPMRAAIKQFIERVRPLIAEAKPLRYAFHETPLAPLWALDDEAEAADGSARNGLRERRFLLIANNPAVADALAQELRANGALVVVMSADGSGWDRARDLDPEVVLIDEEGLNHWGFDAVSRLTADPQLRWAALVVMDARELLPEDGPPRVERLAANIAKLTESDAALRARAASREVFDLRIETVGPTRLLRALLSTGGAWNLHVRPRGGALLRLALAEGLVAGASAQLPDGRVLEAAPAFACLLVAGAGRLRAEPATHPALANMLMPLDEAVRAAHAEGSPMPVTHSPSAPPPPPERASRPSSPPRARAVAPSTETDALVVELEDLVGGLQEALHARPASPKPAAVTGVTEASAAGTAMAGPAGAAPKPPSRTASPTLAPAPLGKPAVARPTAPPAMGAARAPLPPPGKPATPPVASSSGAVRAPLAPARGATAAVAGVGARPPAGGSARSGASAPSAGAGSAGAAASGPAAASAGPAAPPPPRAAPRAPGTRPPPPTAGAKSLPPPPPAVSAKAVAPLATRTSLPPPPPSRTAEDSKPTLPPLRMDAPVVGTPVLAPAVPATRPPPPPAQTAQTAPGPIDVPRAPAVPAMPPPAAPPPTPAAAGAPAAPVHVAPTAPRTVPMPQRGPSASQEHTLPQPMGPVPMPQRGPSASQEHTLPQGVTPSPAPTEGPRGPRVSPMHLAVGLGVVAAGVAGFALVFWIAGRAPADAAALAAPAAASAPAPAATPAAAAPPSEVAASGSPALPTPRASVPAAETASGAPRLPFVDPGPMPEEHAGSDAIVDRFRESLSRGSRARSRGDLEGALQAYRFAVHLKPRSTDAVLGMARTYQDAEQLEDALRWAERARDVELRGIEGRLTVGDLLLSLGRHDQAIATWREAQARAPRDSSPGERIRRAEEALAEQD